jgi:hypothetical protein
MTIIERPALFSPTGGLLPNPVRYVVATSARFVSVEVVQLQDYQATNTPKTIGRFKAQTRSGQAVLDISSVLRSAMPKDRTTAASLVFYCIFTDGLFAVLNDSANIRNATASALDYGVTTYEEYTATGAGHEAKFATLQNMPTLFEGRGMQLNIAIGDMLEVFFEREYIDAQGNVLMIRSDYVEARNALLSFHVEEPPPPPGTRYINARLTNENRAWIPEGSGLNDWLDADFLTVDWY